MRPWAEKKVSDLIDGLVAGVSVRSRDGDLSRPAVLKTSAVAGGRVDFRETKAIIAADVSRAKCAPVRDSIVVSRMNTPALVGAVGYVEADESGVFLPGRLWLARSRRTASTDMRWLNYALGFGDVASRVRELATGTSNSMKNIPKSRLLELSVLVPIPEEQRAISTVLADIDGAIACLERLVAKKRAIKQGVMQELLTGSTRLPGFDGEWTPTTLGAVVDLVGGGTPARGTAEYWGGSIPWATVKDVSNFNPCGTQESITPAALRMSSARLVRAGTPILAVRMLVGKSVRFQTDVAINQDLKALLCGPEVEEAFLCNWFVANGDDLAASAGGSTVAGTSTAAIRAMDISIPSVEEQLAIAAVLDDTDAEIVALERRLEATRNIKKGMMQELLTGRTRLPVNEEVTV